MVDAPQSPYSTISKSGYAAHLRSIYMAFFRGLGVKKYIARLYSIAGRTQHRYH